MKGQGSRRFRFVLPLPVFVLHPLTAVIVAAVHVYLAAGHLWPLIGGEVKWTDIWKGFGALGGVTQALYNRAQQGRLHGDPHWNQLVSALTVACSLSSPVVGAEDPARQLTTGCSGRRSADAEPER